MALKKNVLTPHTQDFWTCLAKLNYLSHSCEVDLKAARQRITRWQKAGGIPPLSGAFLIGFDPYAAKADPGHTVHYGGHLFKADDLLKASEEAAGITQSHYLSQAFEAIESLIKRLLGDLLWEWRKDTPPVISKKKWKSLNVPHDIKVGTPGYYIATAAKVCSRNTDDARKILWDKLPGIETRLRSTRHGGEVIDRLKAIEVCRHCVVHSSGLGLSESRGFKRLTDIQKTHALGFVAKHFGREVIAPSRGAVGDMLVTLAEVGHVIYTEASVASGMQVDAF